MKKRTTKKGFTLVEMLIASSLFALIGTLTLTIFITSTRSRASFATREMLYDDVQFVINQLEREIANNAIDYEEYYNQIVLNGDFGMNFGYYATQFYYSPKTDDYGTKADCQLSATECVNLGQNPANQNPQLAPNANAFKEAVGISKKNIFCTDYNIDLVLGGGSPNNYVCVKDLYLISPTGDKKTFIVADTPAPNQFKLKKGQMIQGKHQGIFTCKEEDKCSTSKEITLINKETNDLENITQVQIPNTTNNFYSIIPNRLNIRDIRFYITPVEDPRKAFAETELNGKPLIHQPTVTIHIEASPEGKDNPVLTLQKKITPAVFEEVRSYPPRMQCDPSCP